MTNQGSLTFGRYWAGPYQVPSKVSSLYSQVEFTVQVFSSHYSLQAVPLPLGFTGQGPDRTLTTYQSSLMFGGTGLEPTRFKSGAELSQLGGVCYAGLQLAPLSEGSFSLT